MPHFGRCVTMVMDPATDSGWMRCQYFEFCDIPRALVLQHAGRPLLLDSPFEEDRDDYRPSYFVWEIELMEPELPVSATWQDLERRKSQLLGELPVAALEFWPERLRTDGRSYAWYRFKPTDSPDWAVVGGVA